MTISLVWLLRVIISSQISCNSSFCLTRWWELTRVFPGLIATRGNIQSTLMQLLFSFDQVNEVMSWELMKVWSLRVSCNSFDGHENLRIVGSLLGCWERDLILNLFASNDTRMGIDTGKSLSSYQTIIKPFPTTFLYPTLPSPSHTLFLNASHLCHRIGHVYSRIKTCSRDPIFLDSLLTSDGCSIVCWLAMCMGSKSTKANALLLY